MALTILVTSADGREYRFGPDEPDPGFVPFGITWESVVPGGWKSASFNLRRRIDEDAPLRLLDEVEILDEHGVPMFEGRIARLPRQHGQDFLLGVECVGWAAHLLDDKTFREIYVDRDLTRWSNMSLQRRLNLAASVPAYGVFDPSVESDATTGEPALKTMVRGAWANRVACAALYDARGVPIGSIYYAWKRGSGVSAGGTVWAWSIQASDVDTFDSGVDTSGDLEAAGPGSGTLSTTASTRAFGEAALTFEGPGGTAALEYVVAWTTLAVFGNHGLTKRGTAPDEGFYIQDMIADALGRAAPKLNFTTGPDGSIEDNTLVVLQAAYTDPTSVEKVILDLNKYVLWDWGVERNKTFFFRPTDPDRLTWEARLDQGVHLSLEGDDAERAYNGAVVRYTDAAGKPRSAGPVGLRFDVESALLTDSSPDNTVNAHGYPGKHIELNVTFPLGSDDLAVTIGASYLAQASLPARSGSITLTGNVIHPTKGARPAREIFAGEWVRLSDHPADVPRRILSVSHDDDTKTTSVTVGNDINKVDAMLEQLGVVTNLAGG
jgi:hypothetical protein